jgi:acyl carrier protein
MFYGMTEEQIDYVIECVNAFGAGKEDNMNSEKYDSIFMSVFDVEKDVLGDDFTFKAVDKWDSFLHLTLISELEDGFDVLFDSEDILNFGGYSNGKKILAKYGVDFGE